jgi:hypothetical protein
MREGGQTMSQVFQALSSDEKQRWQSTYLSFLQKRDGTPNLQERSFDVRETFFADIDQRPIRWQGEPFVNKEIFQRNLRKQNPDAGLDIATLWALTVAKVNRSERFGIEYSLARKKPSATDASDPYVYASIEEMYHTRILRDVVELFGLEMEMTAPPFLTRYLIQAMSAFPKSMANILVLNGEIGGVVIFHKLMQKGEELLSSQPQVWSRAKELFTQILTDEIGHVYFLRSTLDATRLQIARALLPTMVGIMLDDMPEACLLFGKENLVREIVNASIEDLAEQFAPALRQ